MARLLRLTRVAVGALTLGTAAPLAAMEWSELSAERDALQGEVQRLRAHLLRQQGSDVDADRNGADLYGPQGAYGGSPLPAVSSDALAIAAEEHVQLTTQAAALRRELARARAELDAWERPEGTLDIPVELRGDDQDPARQEYLDLLGETDQLRRRLVSSDRDLEEVQLERDEALAQLRREMFSTLLYSTIIGECGHRSTPRAVEACADEVRTALHPHWARFEACVQAFNAVPAYSQSNSARDLTNAVRLDRGAVLMCDPGLPEGGER